MTNPVLIPFYFEVELRFPGLWTNCDEFKKGVVLATDEQDAKKKVISEFEGSGGKPEVYVTIFPTLGAHP